ncbi:phosphodiester glycosidase family protein [Paenibacillus amylolyticus]|uniref:phosphodiester glycosidase family protein n=1 Tax=Paenibacillus amylolyticus TaxID=1451 RepID=UPI003393D870
MKLGSSEAAWKTQATKENIQNADGAACRSAAVYNNTKNLWLVVTDTKTTAAKFRADILEKIGLGTLVDGIMLDGSGSSQYKVAEGYYSGSDAMPRKVYQMMALR